MTRQTRQLLLAVYATLDSMHASRGWHWWPDGDPFEVSVGAILVQNTSWTNVEHALHQLRTAKALEPAGMRVLTPAELEELVRPSGQYRQKARKLLEFLALIDRHGSLDALLSLPPVQLRAELLGTWGIGPETADAIVLYAARQPAFVIDTYTRRLFGRLSIGPLDTSDYHEWQRFFLQVLPADRDLWARYHALIVMHNKHLCLKSRPRCRECLLATSCPAALAH
jgi:endonuclease-3 related protein